MIRTLDEQFDSETSSRIRKTVSVLSEARYPEGASSYYAAELRHVLQAGALLAALSLACTLLESVVRGLVLQHARPARHPSIDLEGELERNRRIVFSDLVDQLSQNGFFDPHDAQRAVQIYRDVRIPIHHALSRRFVTFHDEDWSVDLAELLRHDMSVTLHDLEAVIEEHAIGYVEEIAGIVRRSGIWAAA